MKKIILSFVMFATFSMAQSQVLNPSHLQSVKQNIERPFYAKSLSYLVAKADSLLHCAPMSVMDKAAVPASGDKHDYMSQARYFWPDPHKSDGLPYVNRDGVTNPEIYKLDRDRLGMTADRIKTLALAYYFTGDEKYAEKAVKFIDVWFLENKTRMNPNLEYAQMIPGHNDGKGRCYGVLDSYSFVGMLDGVRLLENSKSFPLKKEKALKKWFGELTDWMLTSPSGMEEGHQANNHSTAYDAEVMAFALYSGKRDVAEKIGSEVAKKRIFAQIEPDGRQPHELTRTLAFGYSQYNLTHLLDIMEMAANAGIPMGNVVSEDNRSIEKGLDFLAGYLGRNAKVWNYQQISGMEDKKLDLLKDLYRAWILNSSRSDYKDIYFRDRILDYSDPFNLTYFLARDIDDAMTDILPQLEFAVNCANKEKNKENNAAKRRVTPRSINADGSLNMVNPYDWCSGFFSGVLWQAYEYSNLPELRETAISWTWPIEDAKWHKGTHDLGFMINNSFGKAIDLTGEQSYKDVVLKSASTLISRYNSTVKSIRSWDHNADVWKFPVIIDNMMNLEMLFQATQLTGDSVYHKIAVDHASTTLANHFRDDNSSFHVVDYDPETGIVRMKCTAQGYSDSSYWSRGQAWGLYGFAQCYQYTGDRRYLEQSEKIADFILSLPNMPSDKVPYWDMKDPRVANLTPGQESAECPRDASSAAILASGLYLLSDFTDENRKNDYRKYADKIIKSLTDSYRIPTGQKYGFILDHSTGHHPAGSEIDVPLNYADYYYMEALLRQSRHQSR